MDRAELLVNALRKGTLKPEQVGPNDRELLKQYLQTKKPISTPGAKLSVTERVGEFVQSVPERVGGFLKEAGQLPGPIQPYAPKPPSIFKQPTPVSPGMGAVRMVEPKMPAPPKTDVELDVEFAKAGLPKAEEFRRVGLAPSEFAVKHPTFASVMYGLYSAAQPTIQKIGTWQKETTAGKFEDRVGARAAEIATTVSPKERPTTGNKALDLAADLIGAYLGFSTPGGAGKVVSQIGGVAGAGLAPALGKALPAKVVPTAARITGAGIAGAVQGAGTGMALGEKPTEIAKRSGEEAALWMLSEAVVGGSIRVLGPKVQKAVLRARGYREVGAPYGYKTGIWQKGYGTDKPQMDFVAEPLTYDNASARITYVAKYGKTQPELAQRLLPAGPEGFNVLRVAAGEEPIADWVSRHVLPQHLRPAAAHLQNIVQRATSGVPAPRVTKPVPTLTGAPTAPAVAAAVSEAVKPTPPVAEAKPEAAKPTTPVEAVGAAAKEVAAEKVTAPAVTPAVTAAAKELTQAGITKKTMPLPQIIKPDYLQERPDERQDLQDAWTVVSTRHPKLAGLIKTIKIWDNTYSTVNPQKGILYLASREMQMGAPRIGEVLAHELTHAAQNRKSMKAIRGDESTETTAMAQGKKAHQLVSSELAKPEAKEKAAPQVAGMEAPKTTDPWQRLDEMGAEYKSLNKTKTREVFDKQKQIYSNMTEHVLKNILPSVDGFEKLSGQVSEEGLREIASDVANMTLHYSAELAKTSAKAGVNRTLEHLEQTKQKTAQKEAEAKTLAEERNKNIEKLVGELRPVEPPRKPTGAYMTKPQQFQRIVVGKGVEGWTNGTILDLQKPEYNARYFSVKPPIDYKKHWGNTVKKHNKTPLRPVATYHGTKETAAEIMLQSSDKDVGVITVDRAYHDYFLRRGGGVTFHDTGSKETPLIVKGNGKIIGLLMPLRQSNNMMQLAVERWQKEHPPVTPIGEVRARAAVPAEPVTPTEPPAAVKPPAKPTTTTQPIYQGEEGIPIRIVPVKSGDGWALRDRATGTIFGTRKATFKEAAESADEENRRLHEYDVVDQKAKEGFPVLEFGKGKPGYLKSIKGQAKWGEFLRSSKEVAWIDQPYERKMPVYHHKGKLVRVSERGTYSDSVTVHSVDPAEYGDKFHWRQRKDVAPIAEKFGAKVGLKRTAYVADAGAMSGLLKEARTTKVVIEQPSSQRKEAVGKVEAELSSEVDKVVEEVSPPVGLSIKIVKNPPPTKGEGFKFSDAATEARYQRAHEGVQREGFWTQIQEIGRTLRNKISREYEHLPRTGEFAPLRYGLLELSKQKSVAGDRTVRLQQGIISKMLKDPATFNLFERKVLLDDLVEEMDAGHDLPLGFTKETLPKEVERLNEEIAKHPEIADALQKRSKAWDAIKKDYTKAMKAIGFDVEKRFTKKNYFRHQVLEYANARAVSGTGQRIKTPTGRGFLKAREGSTYDINTNYLQADFEVMAQMLYDIEVANTIRLVDDRYNIAERLKREAARLNMVRLSEMAEKDETITARLTAFRQQIAIGMSKLGKLAEQDKLPTGDKGEFEDVVEQIIEDQQRMEDMAEEDVPTGSATGTPGAPMGEEGKRFFAFLSWLLKQDTEGAKAAGQILKAVSHRREFIRETLGQKFVTYEDIIPEGYEIWQPREGNIFYSVESVPSQVAQKLLEEGVKEVGIKPEDLRKALAMGGPRREFVVKSEVAQTLDNFGKKMPNDPVSTKARQIMGGWKQYQLINPKRVVKYNARNLSGDAEAVFLGNPSTFKKVGQAASELYQTLYGDRSMTPTMRDWFERGGMESTLQVAELGDINQLRMFSKLFEDKRSIPKKMWDSYVKSARLGTDFREAILRYAAYLDYLEQMQKNNGRPLKFGASIEEEIMALKDVKDRAFVLSNQLLGAYDQVSVAGQAIRTYLAPFWSWKEVNAKRYWQFVKNAASDGKIADMAGRSVWSAVKRSPLTALRVGKFLIKASALWAMLTTYNNLRFPDEEKDLSEDIRNRPHIVLGRDKDGKVKYFDRLGILGDMLEWFGLDAPQSLVVDYLNGRKTMKDIAAEMGKGFVNTAVQTLGPHIKLPFELLTGKKSYPDVFNQGTIRDKWLYLAESAGLGDEYKLVAKMPSRPYYQTLQNIISSSADPGESSYYDILDEKNEYARKIGKGSDYGGGTTPKSRALYYLKMAVRYGDKAAFEKYLLEYVAAGGSEQGYDTSVRNMAPLYGLSSSEKKEFREKWLDDEGREKLRRAEAFYKTVIKKGEKIPGATKEIRKALPERPKKSAGTVLR